MTTQMASWPLGVRANWERALRYWRMGWALMVVVSPPFTPPASAPSNASATHHTRAVTSTNSFAMECKTISDWHAPGNQSVVVLPGLLAPYIAFYMVPHPLLVVDRAVGIGITATSGTTSRIEGRSAFTSASWVPQRHEPHSVQRLTPGSGESNHRHPAPVLSSGLAAMRRTRSKTLFGHA